jgi:hypothetical protein
MYQGDFLSVETLGDYAGIDLSGLVVSMPRLVVLPVLIVEAVGMIGTKTWAPLLSKSVRFVLAFNHLYSLYFICFFDKLQNI